MEGNENNLVSKVGFFFPLPFISWHLFAFEGKMKRGFKIHSFHYFHLLWELLSGWIKKKIHNLIKQYWGTSWDLQDWRLFLLSTIQKRGCSNEWAIEQFSECWWGFICSSSSHFHVLFSSTLLTQCEVSPVELWGTTADISCCLICFYLCICNVCYMRRLFLLVAFTGARWLLCNWNTALIVFVSPFILPTLVTLICNCMSKSWVNARKSPARRSGRPSFPAEEISSFPVIGLA